MAICLNCGAIIHDDDIFKHVCKSNPIKNTEKIPNTEINLIDDLKG